MFDDRLFDDRVLNDLIFSYLIFDALTIDFVMSTVSHRRFMPGVYCALYAVRCLVVDV